MGTISLQLNKPGNDVKEDLVCGDDVGWLNRRQKVLLCRGKEELSTVIRKAATQAVAECRYQFSNELWNCPLEGGPASSNTHVLLVLKKIEKSGN
jgi:wnt family